MKKTLIALIALGGAAMATDLTVQNGVIYELGIDTLEVDHLLFGSENDLTGTYTTVVKAGHENKLWSIMRDKNNAVGTIDFSLEDSATASTKHDAGNMNWNAKEINLTLGDGATMTFGNSLNMKYADQQALTITLGENSTLTFGGRASLGIDSTSSHQALTLNFGAGSQISASNQVISFGDIMQNASSSISITAQLSDAEMNQVMNATVGTVIERTLITSSSIDHLTDCGGVVTGSVEQLSALGMQSVGIVTDAANIGINQYGFVKDGGNLKLYINTPEPATATLSLLALAGLAARRRRH